MPQRLLWAIAIIVVFTFFMNRKNRKVRAAVWAGRVTAIEHQRPKITRDEDRSAEDWVTIHYRTDAGQDDRLKIRMRVMRQYFSSLAVGDRLNKQEGEWLPQIESQNKGVNG